MSYQWVEEVLPKIIATRQAKGFRPTTREAGSFCTKLLHVLSELEELKEAAGEEATAAFEEECADVGMLLLVIIYDLSPQDIQALACLDDAKDLLEGRDPPGSVYGKIITAWDCWHRDEIEEAIGQLVLAAVYHLMYCTAHKIDLKSAILRKDEKNRSRSRLFGGKHPDS